VPEASTRPAAKVPSPGTAETGAEGMTPSPDGPPRRLGSTRRSQAGLALAGYSLVSAVLLGLPVLLDPGDRFVGWGTDPSSFVWYLNWMPHAIGHGMNPLHTAYLWAPTGFDLTHATSVPGPALLLMPITLLFGPVVAYNVMALAAPALAAWASYLLCRHLTGSLWPSVVGGYLFGFSTYVLGHMLGHPNLSLVFLIPLAVLLVVRRIQGDISPRRFVLLLALLLGLQFLISTEVFLTLTLFGGMALGIGAVVAGRDRRAAVGWTAVLVGMAYLATGLLMSPYLASFFASADHKPVYDFYPEFYVTDAVNVLVPTPLTALGSGTFEGVWRTFTGDISEQAGYFGLPLMAMTVGFWMQHRGTPVARVLISIFLVALLASLGPVLHVAGTDTMTLPWAAIRHLPLVEFALPARLTVYAWLAAAVMASLWLAGRTGGARWVVAGLAILMLLPNLRGPFWNSPIERPEFFARGLYREHIREGANVLVVPYASMGHSMLWQAESGMYFPMPGGNAGVRPPPDFGDWPVMGALLSGTPIDEHGERLKEFLGANEVEAIVVVRGTPGLWPTVFGPLGVPPVAVGGVDLYLVSEDILREYADAPRPVA
jgi:hypothetical protein